MRLPHLLTCGLLVLALACNGTASGPARVFVQDFYSWYVPRAQNDASGLDAVLRERSDALGAELAAVLRKDVEAREKATGEIAGLDFDPFLFSQDPCERYEVGNVTAHGSSYRVAIHGVCSGTRSAEPSVTAEVAKREGRFVIVNLHYPGGWDLLSMN